MGTTKISATLSNQVLKVVMPKSNQVKESKKIKIVDESESKEKADKNEEKNDEEKETKKQSKQDENVSKESVKANLTQDLAKQKKTIKTQRKMGKRTLRKKPKLK